MKHKQAMTFSLTSEEMHTLKHANDILDAITNHLPKEYVIEAYNELKFTMDEIEKARCLVYSIGDYYEFIGYSDTEEESW